MIGSLSAATARTLNEARHLQARTRLSAAVYTTLWQAVAGLLAAGLLDMLVPWPAAARGVFLATLGGGILWRLRRARKRERPDRLRPEQVAREIEAQRPELDNALIHAVQFSPSVENEHNRLSAELMRREIERAEQEAARLPVSQVVERAAVERGRRALLLVGGGVLLTALLFPRAYRFEVPRFFLFWTDAPPFTLTDFDISPIRARVRSGSGLTITARLGGLMPKRVELITGRAGEPNRTLPLMMVDTAVHTAQLEGLTRDTWYYVAADTGRSARYWIEVDAAPRLKRLTVTTHAPDYARRPDETKEIKGDGVIEGLSGTKVTLEVESDQPLGGGELQWTRDRMGAQSVRLTPKPGAPAKAQATFTLERDGDYRIGLVGASAQGGLRTPDAARGKLLLHRDEKPLVSFALPAQNVIARPDMIVPLKAEAEDDIAVQRVEIHRIVNRGKDTMQEFPVPDGSREAAVEDQVDLKAMGAKPGDVIEYYATAYDNDPKGIHNSDSDRYWVWVVSEEDYRKLLEKQRGPSQMAAQYRDQVETMRQLAEEQQQLAREMAAAAEQEKALKPGDTQAKAAVQQRKDTLRLRQQDLQNRASELAKQMRELAQQKPQYPVEKGLQQRLNQLAQSLQQAQAAMQQARSAPNAAQTASQAQAAGRQMQQGLKGAGEKIEQMVEALEKLAPLYADLARLQTLAKEQTQLAQQAQQLRDSLKNNPADSFAQSRLQSLAEQQARHRDALNQIEQDLQSHGADAQTVAPEAAQTAKQLSEAIQKLNIGQRMEAAQQALEQQNANQGAQQAEAARQALESLMGQSRKGQSQCNGACNSLSLNLTGSGAGNSLTQLAQKLGFGMPGQGNGEGGAGQGSGGYSAPTPGSRPGQQPGQGMSNGEQAMVMNLMTRSAGSRPRKEKKPGPKGERINDLSADNTERVAPDTPRLPTKATDKAASRYPTEYRRLVQDYFRSVAGGK